MMKKRNKSPCLIIFEMISIGAVNDKRYKKLIWQQHTNLLSNK
jgi:hypothetical protein